MPQPLTLIYYPTENSKMEFQVSMTKDELLSKMYFVSSTTNPSCHKQPTEEEKQILHKDMKNYFSRVETETYCCFWSTRQPSLNITILRLGRNAARNIYTDFSRDVIDITLWVKKNNISSEILQELFVDENQKSLIMEISFKEPIELKGVDQHNHPCYS